jgi:hypothetical protein
MPEYRVECDECGDSFETGIEEEALGWLFGHGMRTGHESIEKIEL